MPWLRNSQFVVLLTGATVFLCTSTALRLALAVRVWTEMDPSAGRAAAVFLIGIAMDLAAFAYASIPVTVWLLVAPERLVRSRFHRWAAAAAWAVFVYVVLFGATVEWYFWDEFGSRFNFVAVDYLVYTREVVGNIRESYPIGVILPVLLAPAAAVFAVTWNRIDAALMSPAPVRARWAPALGVLAVPAIAAAAVTDDAADFCGNRVADQLARNGLHSFVSAFLHNQLDYDAYYATAPEPEVLGRVRSLVGAPDVPGATDLTRPVAARRPEIRPNVVLVCVESLSAWFLREFAAEDDDPHPQALTPRLDDLADRSLFFTRLYATGTRTVRGLEALTLSVPPTPGVSVVKRPANEDLFSLGFVFRDRGYDTRFIYGGFGYFDNMNAFFAANGFDVVDRTDLADDEVTFSNVWGVCDEDLFARTLKECDRSAAAGRPFFHFLMTTSNHRPFTYPAGRVPIPSGTGREGAVQYTDHAIGKFLDDAARRPWFANTIFVVVADHCSSARGKTELPVNRFHIPMWIYAPALVPPARCDALCSQIDVAPTLLGLLGWSYDSRFFGVDALERPPQRALVCNYLHVGLYDGQRLLTLGPNREVTMDRVAEGGTKVRRAKQVDPSLQADAIAWYEGASHLLATGRQKRIVPSAQAR
jgi:phosphoglycerol transferase MdoB-like AlkP superfamily enzyme